MSARAEPWQPGTTVLLRHHMLGRVSMVQTARVVRDSADELVLWWAPGWPCVRSAMADGRSLRETPPAERAALPRVRQVATWTDTEVLAVVPTGAAHSVWVMRWADGRQSYYVNLERPEVRRRFGDLRVVDTRDHELDLIVSTDLARWRWKDEEDFAAATGVPGYWTRAEADRIRAEGQRVLEHARAGRPPFDGRWLPFRPDPTWTVPSLPADWDRQDGPDPVG